ncbi:hypothetical protein MGALJ_13820 [Mycobacterium gallinarum]|uniref:Uncharacterized protein n=1 Tax=Mycobacterium gallinarum TaxID=39689 RepID=A0A9W4B841_9MYCO|nr:hypothetical protein MGALJ_13820 [Mycobacterium gallinarum]
MGALCELVSNLEWGNPDELAGAYLGLSTPHPEAAKQRLRLEKGWASTGKWAQLHRARRVIGLTRATRRLLDPEIKSV